MIRKALSVRGHSRKLLHAISALLLLLNIAAAPLTSAQPVFSPAAKPAPPQPNSAAVQANMAALPLAFEPNRGQADPQLVFLAHSAHGAIGFMPTGLLIRQNIAEQPTTDPLTRGAIPMSTTAATLGLSWQGSNPQTVLRATAQLPGVVNYLRGNDPAHWQRDVPTYGALTYENLYPGIDLHYDGDGHGLKGTYTVTPGADPTLIRWRYDAAAAPTLDPAGNLQIQARTDPAQHLTASQQQAALVTEQAPVAWQEQANGRAAVSARFLIAADGSVGFALGAYDRTRPLVLDPYLLYSTPLGWVFTYSYGITSDASGAIYVTGITSADIFPTVNPVQGQFGGDWDAFVTKISPGGGELVYSTYLGGRLTEVSNNIAVDAAGNAYVTGFTGTVGYPVTPGAFDTQEDSLDKAFISVLNQRGDGFVYSTFLGLPQAVTHGWGVAVTPDGWATVTGNTECRCFPERRALFPQAVGQGFVARFSPDGQLDYGTGIPGTSNILAVALDAAGNAYFGGYTEDPFLAFLPFLHAIQVNWHGSTAEGFVLALAADGSRELYGTFLGGGGNDVVQAVTVNAAGEATVSGWTASNDLFPPVGPLLQTAPLQAQPGGGTDGFVARFRADGSSLLFATYLGGSDNDYAYGVAVDGTGAIYITGSTKSTNFPTAHAIQWTRSYPPDTFVSKLRPGGTSFVFSTYLGGRGVDEAWSITVSVEGTAYLTGNVESQDFPLARPLNYPTPGVGTTDGGSFVAGIGESCNSQFSDVPEGSAFYPYVRALACRALASGYADGSFRVGAGLTRGQLAKIVVAAANLHASHLIPPFQQSFFDVPPGNPFWWGVEQLAEAGIISGYPCGQAPGEPCGGNGDNRPYFRPNAPINRAQAAKLVVQTIGWRDDVPARQQSFADVLPADAFWLDIERLKAHGAIAGYTCGQAALELCDDADRPYYRPGASVTRGQAAKIAANSFYPNDEVPSPTPTSAPATTKGGSQP